MAGVMRKLTKVIHAPNGHDRKDSADLSPTGSTSHSPAPHRRSLAAILHRDRAESSASENDSDDSGFDDSDSMSKNQQKRQAAKQRKKEQKSRLSLEHRDDSEERTLQRLDEAAAQETEDMRARYGKLPLMQSTTRNTTKRINIDHITEEMVGQEVTFRCRLHHIRNMSSKLVFLVFRQQLGTIQGVMHESPGMIGPTMIHWAEHLHTGSIMLVKGVIQKPGFPIKSATIHNVEIHVTQLHTIVDREEAG